jgi:diguanylate cyclase (GGDEF)-like protein
MTVPTQPAAEPRAAENPMQAMLENISLGVAKFDAGRRLVASNPSYALIYRLAPAAIRPGMTLDQIVAMRAAVGTAPRLPFDQYLSQIQGGGGTMNSAAGTHVELGDGRVISTRVQPLPDGGYVTTHEDISEWLRAERELVYLGRHDALTGLANRMVLREQLRQVLATCDEARPCAVISVFLDGFKDINDTLGHDVGDEVLRVTAARLRQAVAPGDLVARTGDCEFVVLHTPAAPGDVARGLAHILVGQLARPCVAIDQQVIIGACAGVALAPRDGTEPDRLLRDAALALAAARTAGRGHVEVFAPAMDAAAQRRRRLDAELHKALARNELHLAYQPVAKLRLRRVGGFEALLRWTHPELGRISPAEFIPLAEQNGLILQIGAWVLKTACADAASWPDALTVSVNVSAAQFHAPGLVAIVSEALAESGLPPSRMILEITESAMMQNWQDTASVLQQIKRLGVRIALDDFGTGFSSLSYLRRFPFDKIKVDQSFVREMTSNGQSVAIVRAILALCGALGMSTTAEGVETPEQFALLVAEGCAEVQGYLLSQPRPVGEVAELLTRLNAALPALWPPASPPRSAGSAATVRHPVYEVATVAVA